MEKKPYCLMPFIHFHVGGQGVVNACCVARIPFGNINEQTVEEVWQGTAIQTLRDKFLAGETDNRCAVCHRLEATGGESIRQETFRKFDYREVPERAQWPVYFDLRFSNVCNFRCRTCWHGASSKWYKDAQALGTNLGASAILTNIQDVEAFIQSAEPALLQAEEFYFAGGEPLVTEAHYILLEWLVKRGATGARLRYNTNFSKLTFKGYDALAYWQHFPEVELLASLDATGVLGEYIRKEMNWATILTNREQIRRLPHIRFKIAPTVSVLNIHHLTTLYQQCLELELIQPEDLYVNILERPNYYNIQILPSQQKAEVLDEIRELTQQDLPEPVRRSFQEVADYMSAEDRSHLWPKFLQQTQQLDELRDEDWQLVQKSS